MLDARRHLVDALSKPGETSRNRSKLIDSREARGLAGGERAGTGYSGGRGKGRDVQCSDIRIRVRWRWNRRDSGGKVGEAARAVVSALRDVKGRADSDSDSDSGLEGRGRRMHNAHPDGDDGHRPAHARAALTVLR